MLDNIDSKLKELKSLMNKKSQLEKKHKEQLDFGEKELTNKKNAVQFKAQTILSTYFSYNLLDLPHQKNQHDQTATLASQKKSLNSTGPRKSKKLSLQKEEEEQWMVEVSDGVQMSTKNH